MFFLRILIPGLRQQMEDWFKHLHQVKAIMRSNLFSLHLLHLFAYDFLLDFANPLDHSKRLLNRFLNHSVAHFELSLNLHRASPKNLEEIHRILIIVPSTTYINYDYTNRFEYIK